MAVADLVICYEMVTAVGKESIGDNKEERKGIGSSTLQKARGRVYVFVNGLPQIQKRVR